MTQDGEWVRLGREDGVSQNMKGEIMRQLLLAVALVASALPAHALTLSSPAFADNGTIPNRYTYALGGQCAGSNHSPPLDFGAVSAGTRSFALTVYDPDGGDWLHWKAWNIPGDTTWLAENAAAAATFSQAANDFGTAGYGGPCPPTPNHRYVFTLYALSATFASEPSASQLQAAALATATLTGRRSPADNQDWSAQNCLFAWAERSYADLLAPRDGGNQTLAPYTYRYYGQTGAYLGISSADGHLYYLGPLTGYAAPFDLGAAAGWYRSAGCE